ncbi:MAG: hypothetical protein K8R11_12125 [Methanococcoides sp.]|nr:hypothetical protein [Methanococcoides sp.]
MKLLAYIAFQKHGCAEFSDIIESTDIPERSAWRYINQYKEKGILETVREKITKVFFKKTSLYAQLKETLIDLSKYLDIGFKHIYGCVYLDSCIIRSQRKIKKTPVKMQPVTQYNYERIIVDTYTKADQLNNYFKKCNIKRRAVVESNGRNKRYSRVID